MLKISTFCSGIGSPEVALKNLGIEHEIVLTAEIDKYARETYLANHYTKKMVNDMTEPDYIGEEYYSDLNVSGLPCQSFSLAGKRLGELDPRGLLFFDFLRYVKNQQPKYFIIENVKGLLSMDDGEVFRNWIQLLGQSVNGDQFMFPHEDSLMYNLHWQVLNTKDYGLPQNRERVFLVGIRNDLPNDFNFPKTIPLKLRLKDILEDNVDEKYYLSDKIIKGFQNHSENMKLKGNGFSFKPIENTESEISSALTARYYKMGIDDNYLKIPSATKSGYETATEGDSINLEHPNSETRRGRVGKQVAQTLTTSCNQGVMIGAMRGRNPENPSDRTLGAPTQQMLEINENGTSNCLTSVQKDNVVIEQIKHTETLFNSKEFCIFTRNNSYGIFLSELLKEIGIINTQEWLQRITQSNKKEEILQQGMYETSIQKQKEKKCNIGSVQPTRSELFEAKNIMRSLLSEAWYRCSPQRRESIKQFIRKFDEIMQKLSYENSQTENELQGEELQYKNKRLWFLRKALSEIQEIRKSSSNKPEGNFRIRKLTPREAFRLQGFPDEFLQNAIDAGLSNSQLYRQAGNSISVPVIQAILKNLLK